MTRILHLSDPHFGAEEPAVLADFTAAVAGLRPDLVVISGDLTQRARRAQFAAARAFADQLPAPVLAVPGNHDAPLWNLALRICDPWRGWRTFGATSVWQDAQVVVAGVNSADPRVWKRGRFTPALRDDLARAFAGAGGRLRLAVMHHPVEHGPGETDAPMRGAALAAQTLAALGVRAVLSGHLHRARAAPLTMAPGVLQVQAGSVISWRRRGEANGFNLIEIRAGQLTVDAFQLGEGAAAPRHLWP